MGELTPFGTSPFDVLFKDFFKTDVDYQFADATKLNHPVDIYEANEGLNIDIACVGLTKKDIDLTIEGDILRVEYKKESGSTATEYIQRNIAKRAFNFGWRINGRFDLSKLEAKLENGLLTLFAPLADEAKPKQVTIK